MRLFFLLVFLGAIHAHCQPVAKSRYFNFYNNPFVDAHHSFYRWAEQGKGKDLTVIIDSLASRYHTSFSSSERKSLTGAIKYYQNNFIRKDLLFSDTLYTLKSKLISLRNIESLGKLDLPLFFENMFSAAMPVFEKHMWPLHSQTNTKKIEELTEQLENMEMDIAPELERVYQATWAPRTLEVQVTYYANWSEAYTGFSENAVEITYGSKTERHIGTQGLEILFHEASHWLVRSNVQPLINEKAKEMKKNIAGQTILWHAVLFYMTGKVVQRGCTTRGIEHELYMVKNHVLDQGFKRFPAAIDPYLDGKTDLGSAIEELVSVSR